MKFENVVKNLKEPVEIVYDCVETGTELDLDDRLNVNGGCKTVVTARTRIGCMKFRECEILKGKRFSLKMKGKV